jgi:surfeit locus 1 family protein
VRFERVVIAVAALCAAAATARLGLWQLDRAAQKTALGQALAARRELPELPTTALATSETEALAQTHRKVLLRGRWLPSATVFLENRQMNGQAGFYVLTPLLMSDNSAVVVQRGWLPRDIVDRTRVAAPALVDGEVELRGRIAPPPSRLYEFAASASGVIRQNLDPAIYAQEIGHRLRPLSVLQTAAIGDTPDGLKREWPEPAADVHKHYGYAFQWFALSLLIVGLYIWFQLIRPKFTSKNSQRV